MLWWSRSVTVRSLTSLFMPLSVSRSTANATLATLRVAGLWVGTGGEGAKYWLQVLSEIKNRGTDDVCIVVCDGLKGLPESIEATWPQAITQTCVLHLIRNSFRFASKRDWPALAKDL